MQVKFFLLFTLFFQLTFLEFSSDEEFEDVDDTKWKHTCKLYDRAGWAEKKTEFRNYPFSLGSGGFGEVRGDGTFVSKLVNIGKHRSLNFVLTSLNREISSMLFLRGEYRYVQMAQNICHIPYQTGIKEMIITLHQYRGSFLGFLEHEQ